MSPILNNLLLVLAYPVTTLIIKCRAISSFVHQFFNEPNIDVSKIIHLVSTCALTNIINKIDI